MLRLGGGNGNGNGNDPWPEEESLGEPDGPKVHWENLLSLRYWGGAVLGGIGFSFLISLIVVFAGWSMPEWGIEVTMFGFIGLSLIGGLVGRRYWCPYCRGMVRAGATVCHHCGREFEV